ncbi:MAG: peptide ABC transporter substrate-binding protein [Oscillospiraceae bacterium]
MKHWTRKLAALLAALLLVSMLSACGGEEETVTLRVCLGGAQETLDPAYTETDDNASILYHLYENLLRQESDGEGGVELVNGVASDYTETDNYDGTISYTFTISSAAKWSDGQPVKAEDFVYAWQRLLDPETASPNSGLLAMIEGYDEAVESGDPTKLALSATEDGRLQVTLSYHCPYFLTSVCAGPATMPVRQDVVESGGRNWAGDPATLVTNGAYVLKAWEKAERLELARNPGYDSGRGPDELHFLFAEDAESAYALYTGGQADFVSVLPEEVAVRQKSVEGWTPIPTGMTEVLLLNRSEAFGETPLRKAFTLSADVEALEALLYPADQLATGLVPYGVRESDGEDFRTVGGALLDLTAQDYASRCEEAREALQEEEDVPAEVELIYLAGEKRQAAVEALRAGWEEQLGIRVRLTPLDEAGLAERLELDDYDLAWVTVRASYADATAFLETGSNGLEEAVAADTVEYSRLMSVLRGALDPLARDNYLHAAEEMTFEAYSVLPLVFRGAAVEKTASLRGVGHDGLGRYLFHAASFES